jgi:tripartite-type tricarboxylate transporter receptor subunit TctC
MVRIPSLVVLVGFWIAGLSAIGPVAQAFPERPVTILVPFAAGVPLDLTARIVGEHMSKTLAQPVTVENVTGGGGSIATTRVARAVPDGHSLLIQQPALAANVTLIPNASFDPAKDLAAIALLNHSPLFLLASKTLNVRSMPEAVTWMKQNTGSIRFAHAGVGSLSHLCALLFVNSIGVEATMIPYRGGTPAIADTLAGHANLYCSSAQLAIEQIKTGSLVGLAVAAKERMELVPGVPTVAEFGYSNIDVSFWQGLFAPSKTPEAVLKKLNVALLAALADQTVQKRFHDVGMSVYPPEQRTPEQAGTLLRQEIKRWGDVIRANKLEASSK